MNRLTFRREEHIMVRALGALGRAGRILGWLIAGLVSILMTAKQRVLVLWAGPDGREEDSTVSFDYYIHDCDDGR